MNQRKPLPTQSVASVGLDHGKVPPQALDFEEAVLGAMLLDACCIDDVIAILKPESFYKDQHQHIFKAILSLKLKSQPVDIITATNELREMKMLEQAGGPVYVTMLTSHLASSAHAEYHAQVVQDCYLKRELIRIGSELLQQAFDESNDSEDIINYVNSEINAVANDATTENSELLRDLLKVRVKEIEEVSKHPDKLIGVPSGFTRLDRMTGGWQNKDLIIIAARPSMGKSSEAIIMALNAAELGYPAGFYSLEMSKSQLIDKAIANSTDMSPMSIRTGKVNWEDMEIGVRRLESLEVYIDDTPALSILKLRSKVARDVAKHKIKIAFVDYLQLMTGLSGQKGMNREQEISAISRGLKQMAKEFNIPVVALSQLNRSVEMRAGDKRPQLSDLRESGAIEQDADVVIFIHRPERYGMMEDENGNSLKGVVENIIAKQRTGPVGVVNLYSNEFYSKYFESECEKNFKPLPIPNPSIKPSNFYEKETEESKPF